MVDENLTDEQQADLVRRWIRENGLFVLGGLGLGLATLIGWDFWKSYKTQYAEEASGIYEELVGKVQANDQTEANSLLAELVSDYGKSPYIELARLRLAKLALDHNDFDIAASYLESLLAGSSNEEMLQIAHLRLARIRLQQGQFDAALAELERANADSAFYTQVNEVRGDIYVAMNQPEKARDSYEAALTDSRQPPVIDRAYVQVKRDNLDVGDAAGMTQTGSGPSNGTDDATATTE